MPSQQYCPVCVCPRCHSVSRACDMVELGLIHSQSLTGSGIPIVMWSLTCSQRGFASREQDEVGGGGEAVRGHHAVPFNGWIKWHIKNHSWLEVFAFSEKGTWWPEGTFKKCYRGLVEKGFCSVFVTTDMFLDCFQSFDWLSSCLKWFYNFFVIVWSPTIAGGTHIAVLYNRKSERERERVFSQFSVAAKNYYYY